MMTHGTRAYWRVRGLGQAPAGGYCDDAGNCFDANGNLVQPGYGSYGGMVKVAPGTTVVPQTTLSTTDWIIIGGAALVLLILMVRR